MLAAYDAVSSEYLHCIHLMDIKMNTEVVVFISCPENEDSRFLSNDAKCPIARQNKTVIIKLIVL